MRDKKQIIERYQAYRRKRFQFLYKEQLRELEWVLNEPRDYCVICNKPRIDDPETGLPDAHGHSL